MDFLPVFLNIRGKPCLIAGGGEVAVRKARLLLRAGARVSVAAPALGSSLQELAAQGKITHHAREVSAHDLNECALVIAATDDHAVNQRVSELAAQKNIPVNVVDNPALCSFIMPSIVDRSPVLIAVSSGGAAPALTRLLRARLETLIPAAYGRLAALAAEFRGKVKQRFEKPEQRRRFWESVLQGLVAERVLSGQDQAARSALQTALDSGADADVGGEVYLVGAGPGDPDLLTFRALRLMQQADVVLYDRLIPEQILNLVRAEAERIYVGKKAMQHTVRQEKINELLVQYARQGKRVLRLKGGDPFIFGRGGEEIDTLAEHGIPFQVAPGITAASGCAAYAGIPLTHRDYAQSCVFVTGHLKDGGMDLNWNALVQPQQTVVVYMGLLGMDVLCRELIAHGMSAAMPAALIQQGATRAQRVLIGTLGTLPDIVQQTEVHAPTLIIIGEVVRLHRKLAWFAPQ
ncbi:MAG: uroporphyrinogen-III C-methyltransferase [Gammaproteobacteria bacterium]|nr:MAG: uroporphyrinogen-III C-methyltransferase [Gammaproteobacteria bacterium]